MALIDHIDGVNRDIYLNATTVGASIHPIDIYKEYRTLRATDETLRVWNPLMLAKGFEPKGGGSYTERYVVLLAGTRIVPYNVSHTLTVIGTVITDDGQSGINCFDRGPLSSTTVVNINYVPPQVEVITISTASGILLAEQRVVLDSALSQAAAANVQASKARKMQTNKAVIANGTVTIYEDDGVTVLHQFSVPDENTRIPL